MPGPYGSGMPDPYVKPLAWGCRITYGIQCLLQRKNPKQNVCR